MDGLREFMLYDYGIGSPQVVECIYGKTKPGELIRTIEKNAYIDLARILLKINARDLVLLKIDEIMRKEWEKSHA